jgi:cellulose synthase/poly-beta-1,6-N-acetylglucosamine synthase-like glycosyltransferase
MDDRFTEIPHHATTEPPVAKKKSFALLGLTFGCWILALVGMGGRLWPIFLSVDRAGQFLVLGLFAGLLIIFWLLGSYYFSLVVLYFIYRNRPQESARPSPGVKPPPTVAILYPTCDDFQRDAALTCVQQQYPSFHVFLLDDSRSPESQAEIERFHGTFPERTTIVRRSDRKGFKAGNLNHALNGPAKDYPVFAVMDADERIPVDFLSRTVGHLGSGEWAFVQANHEPTPRPTTVFAQVLGQTILPFWEVLLSIKNRFGFVPCVGHGLVVLRSAWESVGGFPEVASEDLGFSARLLAAGLRGYYAADVVCQEDFPPTLGALRQQQKRYLAGVFEAAVKFWPRTLRQKKISIVEKIDFLLGCLPLYVPVFCLAFLVVLGVGMVLAFGTIGTVELKLGGFTVSAPYLRTFDDRFRPMWAPAYVALSLLFSLSPAFPALALAVLGRIRRPIRLLITSNLVFLSMMFVWIGIVFDLLRRIPIQFHPTMATRESGRSPRRSEAAQYRFVVYECLASAVLGTLLLCTLNFGLAAIAGCPIMARLSGKNMTVSYIMAFVVSGGISMQFLIGSLAASPALGLTQLAFSIHF